MSLETELKLSLSAPAATALIRHRLLAGQQAQVRRLVNIYYDTPELDLWRARLAVRHRRAGDAWLLTVKGGNPATAGLAQRAEWERESLPGVFDFSHVEVAATRRRLDRLSPRLQPLFVTDFRRQTWVVSPAPGVRIEVALDRGKVSAAGRSETIRELELELLEGPLSALFDLALAFAADVPLLASGESKAELGFRLFRSECRGAARASPSPLDARQTARSAFRAVALACLDQLQRNLIGLRDSDDPEFVHQARVAIRRLRAALALWAPVLPEAFVAVFRPQWQAAARCFDALRDLDVVRSEVLPALFAEQPRLRSRAKLAAIVEAECALLRTRTRRRVARREFLAGILDFVAQVHALDEMSEMVSHERFAAKRLRHLAGRMARRAAAVADADDQVAACHALRIACKRLRYAGEFLAPLYPDHALSRKLAGITKLQTELGHFNDLAMARQILGRLAPEPAVLRWLSGQAQQARDALLPRLADPRSPLASIGDDWP